MLHLEDRKMKNETRIMKEIAQLEKIVKNNPEYFVQQAKEDAIEKLKSSLYDLADNLFQVLSAAAKAPPKIIQKDEIEVYTPDTLSKKLGVSKAVLRTWRFRGRGPKFFKDGSNTFYTSEAVKEWAESKGANQSTAEYFSKAN